MNNSENKIILLVSLIGIYFQKKFTPPERKGILYKKMGEGVGWLAASRNSEERF